MPSNLLADSEVERTGEHAKAATHAPSPGQALAAALGELPPLDPRAARRSYSEGVALVRTLQTAGHIDKTTAENLTYHLSVLYMGILIEKLSANLGVTRKPEQPDFLSWLLRSRK